MDLFQLCNDDGDTCIELAAEKKSSAALLLLLKALPSEDRLNALLSTSISPLARLVWKQDIKEICEVLAECSVSQLQTMFKSEEFRYNREKLIILAIKQDDPKCLRQIFSYITSDQRIAAIKESDPSLLHEAAKNAVNPEIMQILLDEFQQPERLEMIKQRDQFDSVIMAAAHNLQMLRVLVDEINIPQNQFYATLAQAGAFQCTVLYNLVYESTLEGLQLVLSRLSADETETLVLNSTIFHISVIARAASQPNFTVLQTLLEKTANRFYVMSNQTFVRQSALEAMVTRQPQHIERLFSYFSPREKVFAAQLLLPILLEGHPCLEFLNNVVIQSKQAKNSAQKCKATMFLPHTSNNEKNHIEVLEQVQHPSNMRAVVS